MIGQGLLSEWCVSKAAGMLCTLSKDSCSSMGLMEYRGRPSTVTFTSSSWSLSRPPCEIPE